MPKIKTDSLLPGMTVACDVKNIDSMLILPAGGTLTERNIDILRAWGVEAIDVQVSGDVQEAADPLTRLAPEALARMTEELKARFWGSKEVEPISEAIFKLMLRRRVQRQAGQVAR